MLSLLLAALASSASATRLFVSNYNAPGEDAGSVTSLEFTPGRGQNAGSLKVLSQAQVCGSEPTWLDQTLGGNIIYCVDEGWMTPNASLNTLKVGKNGSIQQLQKLDTIQGPVATQFYNKGAAIAMAHYGGAAISTYTLSKDRTTFTPLQQFVFDTPAGPRPEQDASHPHQAVLDPTGQFLVFPDLGADLVHVYSIDKKTNNLTAQAPLKTAAGYGPRHAVFWSPKCSYGKAPIYLFVINELSNKVTSYKVDYPSKAAGSLCFSLVQDIGLYGSKPTPEGSRAGEILVSPDNRYIMTSNRNATIFTVDNPDPRNSTQVGSDSLTVFKPGTDGKLTFVDLAPSGGSFPRHFSFNKDGTLVAVANQNSFTMDIFKRDVKSGKMGDRVASAYNFTSEGGVNNVIWED